VQEMEKAMANPDVQKEMAEYMKVMQNPDFMKRMQELREDPELKPMFEEMAKGGPAAVMKYMNDPKYLRLIGSKMGDMPMPGGGAGAGAGAGAAGAAAPQAPPEVTNLLEACKYNDVEAAEDFIAIGKDINTADNEGRTPAHYAAGTGNGAILSELVAAGAALEATDSKGNTPLHYAAGYGRGVAVEVLLEAGADASAKNASGKAPFDLVKLSEQNPINQDEDIMYRLEQAVKSE